MQQHSELKGMTARTIRALWRARHLIDSDFAATQQTKPSSSSYLNSSWCAPELQRMNQFDILGRYLPSFGKIIGQMQHDLFHAYTVDQHIMRVLRNLRRFSETEFGHEYSYCSQLIGSFDRPWLLYVAALSRHCQSRGGHSELGAIEAQAFCDSHGLSAEDSEMIVWPVHQHQLGVVDELAQ